MYGLHVESNALRQHKILIILIHNLNKQLALNAHLIAQGRLA